MKHSIFDIADLFGIPISKGEQISLGGYPSLYADMFDAIDAQIGETPCILLVAKSNLQLRSALKAVEKIQTDLGKPCVLVSSHLSRYQKQRLSKEGIAWLSSSDTFHIPFLGMASARQRKKHEYSDISPQTFRLLAEYLSGDLDGMSTQQVAQKIGKGLSVTSDYFKELDSLFPGIVGSQGRRRFLDPDMRGDVINAILNREKPRIDDIRHPEYHYYLINMNTDDLVEIGFKKAGVTALASSTMVADDDWTTLAIGKKAFKKRSALSEAVEVSKDDDPNLLVEVWPYELDGRAGDSLLPLEIWLSLNRESAHDERIADALEEVIRGY